MLSSIDTLATLDARDVSVSHDAPIVRENSNGYVSHGSYLAAPRTDVERKRARLLRRIAFRLIRSKQTKLSDYVAKVAANQEGIVLL